MSQIPERTFTFQYKPLTSLGESGNTPSVADGTEIKLFAESIKEIYQKEPSKQAIQRGPQDHFKGDKQLLIDSMNDKHKFEVTAYVYSNRQGKHSLDSSILNSDGTEASITTQTITAEEFDTFIPLGDTRIKHGSETVSISDTGTSLSRGTDYKMDYGRGRISFLNSGNIDTRQKEFTLFGTTLSTTTVINDNFDITYTFDASARNIGKMVRRMGQLGNPLVMRMDKDEFISPSTQPENGEEYLAIPTKTQLVGKSEKPDDQKLELEIIKGTVDEVI